MHARRGSPEDQQQSEGNYPAQAKKDHQLVAHAILSYLNKMGSPGVARGQLHVTHWDRFHRLFLWHQTVCFSC